MYLSSLSKYILYILFTQKKKHLIHRENEYAKTSGFIGMRLIKPFDARHSYSLILKQTGVLGRKDEVETRREEEENNQ